MKEPNYCYGKCGQLDWQIRDNKRSDREVFGEAANPAASGEGGITAESFGLEFCLSERVNMGR